MQKLAKPVLFVLSLWPAAWLIYRALWGSLGVNPAETIQLQTGLWALNLLLITLAVTPIRRLTGWNKIIQFRRMLGLFAFFYASLHVLAYLAFDLLFAFGAALKDVAKRPFITAGFIAFVLMLPLAMTSTRGWIRRLGRRWQSLHRLIYVSGLAAVVHFLWKVKLAAGTPVYYALALALLLGFRAAWSLRNAKLLRSQRVSVR